MKFLDAISTISGIKATSACTDKLPFAQSVTTRQATLFLFLLHTTQAQRIHPATDNDAIANGLAHSHRTLSTDIRDILGTAQFIAEYLANPFEFSAVKSFHDASKVTFEHRVNVISDSIQHLQELLSRDLSQLENQAAILWNIFRIGQAPWLEQKGKPRLFILDKLPISEHWQAIAPIMTVFCQLRDFFRHQKIQPEEDAEANIQALFSHAMQQLKKSDIILFCKGFTCYAKELITQITTDTENPFAALLPLTDEAEDEDEHDMQSAAHQDPAAQLEERKRKATRQLTRLRTDYSRWLRLFDALPSAKNRDTLLFIARHPKDTTLVLPRDRLQLKLLDEITATDIAQVSVCEKQLADQRQRLNQFKNEIIASHYIYLICTADPQLSDWVDRYLDIIVATPSFLYQHLVKGDSAILARKDYIINFIFTFNPYIHPSIIIYLFEAMRKKIPPKKLNAEFNPLDTISYIVGILFAQQDLLPNRIYPLQLTIHFLFEYVDQLENNNGYSMINTTMDPPLAKCMQLMRPQQDVIHRQVVELLLTKIKDIMIASLFLR